MSDGGLTKHNFVLELQLRQCLLGQSQANGESTLLARGRVSSEPDSQVLPKPQILKPGLGVNLGNAVMISAAAYRTIGCNAVLGAGNRRRAYMHTT